MAEHRGGSGNFAEDREKASEAGRKGGQHSGGTLKMILNVHPKPVKRVVRTVMAVVVKPVTVND
ncbi:Conidiation-specific protein 10 [Klebsiella variicola]|nr:Conidiation-specific protein 10 [Klebsiella variicola]